MASQTQGNIGVWNLKLAMTADGESAKTSFAELGAKVEAERQRQESSWAKGLQKLNLDWHQKTSREQNDAAYSLAQQKHVAEQKMTRDELAMRKNGINIIDRMNQTSHEKRMRQLLTEDGTVRGTVGGGRAGIGSAADARNQAAQATGRAGKIGGIFQEFGRGFEDFVVSASMAKTTSEGLAMGLRGSANNAAQLAASFDPIVGAGVAIGASLATVILPHVVRWLFLNEELEKSSKRHEENVKNAGQAQLRAAEDLAKMMGIIRKDQKADEKDRGKDVIKGIEDQHDKTLSLQEEAAEKARKNAASEGDLSKAEAREKAAKKAWDQMVARKVNAGVAGTLQDKLFGISDDDKAIAEEMNAAKKQKEIVAAEVATVKAGLIETEKAMLESQQTEADMRLRFAGDIAKAETDIDKDEQRQLAEWQADEKVRQQKILVDKQKMGAKDLHAWIDNDLKAKEQVHQDRIDALQERIQKSGNAAGPSAALIRGTQAAESAINRALSGSRSVEDTMKAQLKVQQDMLKALQKQKQTRVASIMS